MKLAARITKILTLTALTLAMAWCLAAPTTPCRDRDCGCHYQHTMNR
jgi:hypothetical protein